jgi:hypothetical protein
LLAPGELADRQAPNNRVSPGCSSVSRRTDELVWSSHCEAETFMRVPSSLKLVVSTWIAALLGALAGRALAEVSSASAQVSQVGANAHDHSPADR